MADVSHLLQFIRIVAVCFDGDLHLMVRQWRYHDVLISELPDFVMHWIDGGTDYPGLGRTHWYGLTFAQALAPDASSLAGYTGVFFCTVNDAHIPSVQDILTVLNMWTAETHVNWRGFPHD